MVQSSDGQTGQKITGVSISEYLVSNRQISHSDLSNNIPVTSDHALGKIKKMWMR